MKNFLMKNVVVMAMETWWYTLICHLELFRYYNFRLTKKRFLLILKKNKSFLSLCATITALNLKSSSGTSPSPKLQHVRSWWASRLRGPRWWWDYFMFPPPSVSPGPGPAQGPPCIIATSSLSLKQIQIYIQGKQSHMLFYTLGGVW